MSSSPESTSTAAQNEGRVGQVVGLWRYPVKSMAGEPLQEAEISWHGVAGDRRWAFIRESQRDTGFPWLTIRDKSNMAQYRAQFSDPQTPERSAVRVLTPSGDDVELGAPGLAAELRDGLQLIKHDRGAFDTLPLSLITTQTIAALGSLVDLELNAERFRPNLVIATSEDRPNIEDQWVGRTLRIGSTRMRIAKRDQRCVVVNVDPKTGERNPAVLRAIANERNACLGVYAQTAQPGLVAVGDDVVLEPPA